MVLDEDTVRWVSGGSNSWEGCLLVLDEDTVRWVSGGSNSWEGCLLVLDEDTVRFSEGSNFIKATSNEHLGLIDTF